MSLPNEDDWPFDGYRHRAVRWAARALGVTPDQVVDVQAEIVGGCGNGTCEWTEVEIDVTTADGRHFHGESSFGDYFSEILRDELDDDGAPTPRTYYQPLFKLHPGHR